MATADMAVVFAESPGADEADEVRVEPIPGISSENVQEALEILSSEVSARVQSTITW